MTTWITTIWKCDEPWCTSRKTLGQGGDQLPDGWTRVGGQDRCDSCNSGRCPGFTGGQDRWGERCPCIHPFGHDGACQCKHQLAGMVR